MDLELDILSIYGDLHDTLGTQTFNEQEFEQVLKRINHLRSIAENSLEQKGIPKYHLHSRKSAVKNETKPTCKISFDHDYDEYVFWLAIWLATIQPYRIEDILNEKYAGFSDQRTYLHTIQFTVLPLMANTIFFHGEQNISITDQWVSKKRKSIGFSVNSEQAKNHVEIVFPNKEVKEAIIDWIEPHLVDEKDKEFLPLIFKNTGEFEIQLKISANHLIFVLEALREATTGHLQIHFKNFVRSTFIFPGTKGKYLSDDYLKKAFSGQKGPDDIIQRKLKKKFARFLGKF